MILPYLIPVIGLSVMTTGVVALMSSFSIRQYGLEYESKERIRFAISAILIGFVVWSTMSPKPFKPPVFKAKDAVMSS